MREFNFVRANEVGAAIDTVARDRSARFSVGATTLDVAAPP
jgi:hypothetical protein